MGNRHATQNILLLGLPQSGKTTVTNYLREHILVSEVYQRTLFSEYDVTFAHKRLNFFELGGSCMRKWYELYMKNIEVELSAIYVCISSTSSLPDVHQIRTMLMMFYYKFPYLLEVPLCVMQTCADSSVAPILEWSTLKEELQLDLILRVNSEIVLIRLVLDEIECLQKNLERMLEWTFYQCQRRSTFLMDMKRSKNKD